MYKPAGYTSVSPYLIVDDANVTLDFVKRVFDAEPSFMHRNEKGGIVHAEFRVDDTIVMVGQSAGGPDVNIHVYVPDVDQSFRRAVEAGGSVVQEIMEKGDGDRRGGVRDPSGTTWWLATMIKDPRLR